VKAEKTYHHGDLRSALLRAAVDLLAERGPVELSLRAVAKAAGVSHAAPYRHFRDKSELLAAIAQAGFESLADAMAAAERGHPDDPRAQLIDAGIAYVRLAVRNPHIAQLMFGGVVEPAAGPAPLGRACDEAFKGLVRIIENGQRDGIYKDAPTMDLVVAAWSMVHGLAMLVTAGQLKGVDSPAQIEDLARTVGVLLQTGMLAPTAG
jgi:AcrR family transcriptional regulator